MQVYVDLIFFVNFFYDFLILITVGLILKRKIVIKKIILSSFLGGLSLLILLVNNNIIAFILKIISSILMCITGYEYHNYYYTLYNICYFYMVSTILAGFLYFLNINLAYGKIGPFFVFKGFSLNYLVLLIISPIVLYYYYHFEGNQKKINYYNDIYIVFDTLKIKILTFLDTGNNLYDPITSKRIIIVNKKCLKGIYNIRSPVYVPYQTISERGLMTCFKPSYIEINNRKIYNCLIGLSPINLSGGIDGLLNSSFLKEINDK